MYKSFSNTNSCWLVSVINTGSDVKVLTTEHICAVEMKHAELAIKHTQKDSKKYTS